MQAIEPQESSSFKKKNTHSIGRTDTYMKQRTFVESAQFVQEILVLFFSSFLINVIIRIFLHANGPGLIIIPA